MYRFTTSILSLLCMLIAISCSPGSDTQETKTEKTDKGLKDYFDRYFLMGASVAPNSVEGEEAKLIQTQFNSLTAENVMKMGPIHPKEDRYNWKPADKIVAFAQKNGLRMRGHTLCWHKQTPDWLFVDKTGEQVSKEVLMARLKDHITTVVSRYKGKIFAWDVVNEVISDDPDKDFRESIWYQICGEDYIVKAFEWAHQADPNAILFYNDYNAANPEKREKIYRLLRNLREAGVPIHGMGLQGHWSVFGPSEDDISFAIERYASLGLSIHITEMDVSIYKGESKRREKRPEEKDEFTPELERRQMAQYMMFFEVFREYRDYIQSVTFWNVSDRHSWLDNFPVRGRKNYPLLFDQELQPKAVYWEVVDF